MHRLGPDPQHAEGEVAADESAPDRASAAVLVPVPAATSEDPLTRPEVGGITRTAVRQVRSRPTDSTTLIES